MSILFIVKHIVYNRLHSFLNLFRSQHCEIKYYCINQKNTQALDSLTDDLCKEFWNKFASDLDQFFVFLLDYFFLEQYINNYVAKVFRIVILHQFIYEYFMNFILKLSFNDVTVAILFYIRNIFQLIKKKTYK